MTKRIKNTIKAGIVGCGGIAQVIHIPILIKLPNLEIAAVCHTDTHKATFVSNRFGVKAIFNDIEEMFRQVALDVVFILTPNNLHLPMSLIALRNGAHVFIERPCARNANEAKQIQKAAKAAGRHVMVGMHSRFRSDIRTIKGFIDNQTIGDIFFVKGEWLQSAFHTIKQNWWSQKRVSGGGVLLDLGIQMVDTSWWLTGKPALKSAKTFLRTIQKNREVEDFCVTHLDFEGDLQMSFTTSWYFPIEKDQFVADLIGLNGTASVNPLSITKVINSKTLDVTPKLYENRARNIFRMAYQNEISHFVNYITGLETVLESGIDDAVEVMQIVDRIYESV